MAKRDEHAKPGHLIRRLQQIAVAIFMAETDGFDITPVQYSALLAIELDPGIDQTTLANSIAYDRATIGGVVEKLERKHLIRRAAGEHDRRTKHLVLSPKGAKLLRDIAPAVESAQKLILAPLSSSQRRAFTQNLERLVHLNNSRSRAPLRLRQEVDGALSRRRGSHARRSGRTAADSA